MDKEAFRQQIREYLDTPPEEHIRRIKSTHKTKYSAMATINAVLGCGMEEAYRLYDECDVEPLK